MASDKPDLSHFKTEAAQWDDNEDHKRTQQQTLQALLENGLLRKDDHLLDFGCGPGGFTCAMAQHVKSAVGVDATAEMIDVARQARAHVSNAMFFKTELTPDTDMAIIQAPFDVIVSLLVLHHIPDVTGQLKLLAKCLKPGGRLVIFDLLLNENSRDFHPLEKHPSVVEHGFSEERIRREFALAGLINVDVKPRAFLMSKTRKPQVQHEHAHKHGHGHGHVHGHGHGDIIDHPMFMAVGHSPS